MDDSLNLEYEKIQQEEIRIKSEIAEIDSRVNIFNSIGWILIILGVVIGIYGIFELIRQSTNQEIRLNELGDFIGGTVASLWALSGLFFIYIAFLGQQKQMLYQNLELQFNRIEVKSTRMELKEQKLQMVEQNNSIKLQRFENTFFNMIKLLHEIVNNIDLIQEKKTTVTRGSQLIEMVSNAEKRKHFLIIKGKDCFVVFYENLRKNYNKFADEFEDEKSVIQKAYKVFYYKYESDLRHYIQNVFQIASIIENSSVENKEDYVDLFRTQFSTHELVIIYYYCLSEFKYDSFINFSEKYRFFKLFNSAKLIKSEHRNFHKKMFFKLK